MFLLHDWTCLKKMWGRTDKYRGNIHRPQQIFAGVMIQAEWQSLSGHNYNGEEGNIPLKWTANWQPLLAQWNIEETRVLRGLFVSWNSPGILDLSPHWFLIASPQHIKGDGESQQSHCSQSKYSHISAEPLVNKSKIPHGNSAPGNHSQLKATGVFTQSRQVPESPSQDIC